MTVRVQEGELQLEFVGVGRVERLDARGQPKPHGMALVDFAVEESSQTLLIEIKDPSQVGVPEEQRKKFIKKMQEQTLIHEELVPKARDSYAFLHLMERDAKPFLYIVILGLDQLSLDPVLLISFKDRLLKRLRHEGREPWSRHYVKDCVVATPGTWPKQFPGYSLTRISGR